MPRNAEDRYRSSSECSEYNHRENIEGFQQSLRFSLILEVEHDTEARLQPLICVGIGGGTGSCRWCAGAEERGCDSIEATRLQKDNEEMKKMVKKVIDNIGNAVKIPSKLRLFAIKALEYLRLSCLWIVRWLYLYCSKLKHFFVGIDAFESR